MSTNYDRTTNWNRLLLFPAPLTLLFLLGCAGWLPGPQATSVKSMTAEHQKGQPIEIISRNGAIHLICDPGRSDVDIRATLRCGGASQGDAQARAEAADVVATRKESGMLTIEPVFPEKLFAADGAEFTVTLPDATGIRVETSNGSAEIQGEGDALQGELTVISSNAPVRVAHHHGPAHLTTSNGRVATLGMKGPLAIKTSNAPVEVDDTQGDVRVHTSNGGIRVTLIEDQSGPIVAETSNATIAMHVGPQFAGSLELDTSNGSVSLQDPKGRIRDQKVTNSEGHIAIGPEGAGAVNRLKTSNGSIRIRVE